MFNNFIGVFGAVAMGCSKFLASYELLILGRYLIGINCGLNTSLVPMYISEIAPLTLRGGLGTVNQLAVTVGLLISQVLGVEGLLGTDGGWPYLLGVALFPSLLQLCLLPMCPESPRYVQNGGNCCQIKLALSFECRHFALLSPLNSYLNFELL
jgi:SP family facilitated glucose transporter-like MFS transporter 1